MNNLANKNAVVTGASSGIGRAAAIALAKEGCNVALLARKEDKLKGNLEALFETVLQRKSLY
jgi:3-oxoacyl-[acyl-carrier protein] reductase